MDAFQARELGQLGSEVLTAYVLGLREKGYSAATVARKVAAVKSFFAFATLSGLVRDNVAASLGSPRVARRAPQGVDAEDVQRLLEVGCAGETAESLRDRAMFTLLYHSGMRVSEMVGLDANDVEIEQAMVRCRGARGTPRRIPLTAEAGIALDEYLTRGRAAVARSRGSEALFLNRRGARLTRQGFWLIMKTRAQSCGLRDRFTPHALRHSFALRRVHEGTALKDLKDLLGVNLSATQVYTRSAVEARPS
jgi:integrase/recombinase XerD